MVRDVLVFSVPYGYSGLVSARHSPNLGLGCSVTRLVRSSKGPLWLRPILVGGMDGWIQRVQHGHCSGCILFDRKSNPRSDHLEMSGGFDSWRVLGRGGLRRHRESERLRQLPIRPLCSARVRGPRHGGIFRPPSCLSCRSGLVRPYHSLARGAALACDAGHVVFNGSASVRVWISSPFSPVNSGPQPSFAVEWCSLGTPIVLPLHATALRSRGL
mmetsp:Transcript_21561/g.51088  ORF Transcript_21561/g.51088 Transcript_21561/m.51088 type:complete len:215 (+) Transcript_21561:197-841(+)